MTGFEPTQEQMAAIDCLGSCVITACPGSGKTAVVSAKVRKVLPDLPKYRGVIAISYTNKASSELKKRCSQDATDVKRSFFGTIDAFCISEIVAPFLPHYFDGQVIVADIVRLSTLDEKLREIYDSGLKTPEDFIHSAVLILRSGKIVLESVGRLSSEILTSSLACRSYIRARYSHVYIDEYQDSGAEQHRLFILLKELGLVATAVGDVKQSIYAFAGRDSEFLKKLCRLDSDFTKFELTQNHRSHPSIVNYSNRLLDPQSNLLPSEINRVYRKTVIGGPEEISEWIDAIIPKVIEKFTIKNLSSIGILVRGNATAEGLLETMKTKVKFSSDSSLESSKLDTSRRFASILRMRFDPQSTVQSLISETPIPGGITEKKLLRHTLLKCRTVHGNALISAMSEAINIVTGIPPSPESLAELSAVLANPSQIAALTPPRDDEVQLMTLHKSKGLEFDVVIHLDLHDWVIPRRIVVEGDYNEHFDNWEQCLNLHYVGVTRARIACFLITSTRRINGSGQSKQGNPSQFFSLPGLENLYKNLKKTK